MANEVKVDITLEQSQALNALNKLNTGVDKFANNAVRQNSRVASSFDQARMQAAVFAGSLKASLIQGSLRLLVGAIGDATSEAINFKRGLLEIQTILPKGEKLTQKTINQLDSLSKRFGTSATSQAKAYYQTISAGITDTAKATDLLTAANQLAVGGLSTTESSVTVLAGAINAYGQSNLSAEDAANTLFKTVQLGVTTIPQLSGAIGRVLPQASALGVSFDEVGAAVAQLTKSGLSTDEAVTRLNALFTELAKRSTELGDRFQINGRLGLSFSQVLQNISKETGDNAVQVNTLLKNIRSSSAAFILAKGNAQGFSETLTEYSDKAGAAADASSKIINEDVGKQLEKINSTINSLARILINELTPAFSSAFKELDKFLNPKETTALDEVNKKVSETRRRLNELIDLRDQETFGTKVLGLFRGKQTEDALIKDLEEQQRNLKKLLAQRAALLNDPPSGTDDSKAAENVRKNGEQVVQALTEVEQKRAIKTQELIALRLVAEEEAALREKQLRENLSAEELTRLQELELQKLQIKQDAETANANLLRDSGDRIAKLNQINEKAEIDRLKKLQQTKKQIRDQELKDEQAFFNAAKSLSQSENKSLAAISKASGLVQIAQATPPAVASSFNYGARIGGPPLGFAFAGVALAAQLEQAKKMAGFADGGVVGGFTGATSGNDNRVATVRTGEMFLNAPQQRQLFDIANGNTSSGGNEELVAAINNLAEQPLVVEVDGREIARTVRNQRLEGFNV